MLLRDHLRAHPEEAAAYAEHKRELERATGGDRAAYVATKPAYVEELLARVRAEHDAARS